MKKMILAALASMVMIGFASAQQQAPTAKAAVKHHGKHGKHGKHKLGKALNLSDEQKQKAKAVHAEYRSKVATLQQNDKLTMGEYKKQMATLKEQKKQNMQQLLTSEQKAKLASLKQEAQQKRAQKSAARLDKVKTHLNLTDDQVAQLKQQQTTTQTQLKSIRENNQLTDEQKRAQVKQLMASNKASFNNLLTAEQKDKLNSLKERKRPAVR